MFSASARSATACLPLALLLACAGCDRAKPEGEQANASADLANEMAATPTPDVHQVSRANAGLALPALPFEGPGGAPATFGAFRGHPVLVNLWATWCAPCVKEMPTLDALAARRALPVVAVSEDTGGAAQVAPFWKAKGIRALTPYTDPHMRLMTALQVDTLPTTILFDARGKEVWRVAGGLDWTGAEAGKLLAGAR